MPIVKTEKAAEAILAPYKKLRGKLDEVKGKIGNTNYTKFEAQLKQLPDSVLKKLDENPDLIEAFAKRSLDDPEFFKAVQKGDLSKLDELKIPITKPLEGGEWITTNEAMSENARIYQEYITGRKANESYYLNDVKFDGIKDGTLIDAKSGYTNFINKTTGEFHSWFKGSDDLIDQAYRQLKAANGTKIQWYFENEITKNGVKKLFDKQGISGIELIFKPIN